MLVATCGSPAACTVAMAALVWDIRRLREIRLQNWSDLPVAYKSTPSRRSIHSTWGGDL